MADSAGSPGSFDSAWEPAGRVLAVVVAALIALAGVLAHVPVWLASLRGFGALVAVLVIVRVASFVAGSLPRTSAQPLETDAPPGSGRNSG
jgi:hypothetical protein